MTLQQRRAAERRTRKEGAKPVKYYRDLAIDEPLEARGDAETREKVRAEVKAMTPEQITAGFERGWFMNPGGHFRRRILKKMENVGAMRWVTNPDGSLSAQFAKTDIPGFLQVIELLKAVDGALDDPYDPERTRADYENFALAQQKRIAARLERDGIFQIADVIIWATEMRGVVKVAANPDGRADVDKIYSGGKWGPPPVDFPTGWLGAIFTKSDVDSDAVSLELAKEVCAAGGCAVAHSVDPNKPIIILHPDETELEQLSGWDWHDLNMRCSGNDYEAAAAAIKKSMN
jgi:hypothetical protein